MQNLTLEYLGTEYTGIGRVHNSLYTTRKMREHTNWELKFSLHAKTCELIFSSLTSPEKKCPFRTWFSSFSL